MYRSIAINLASDETRAVKALLYHKAACLFSMSRSKSRTEGILGRLLGRNMRMLNLAEIRRKNLEENRVYIGSRTVPIDRIRGSESRCDDFDINLRPLHDHLRHRWIDVAVARLSGVSMPAVELIHVGGFYFIRDGHHRVSIARALGEKFIDAIVLAG